MFGNFNTKAENDIANAYLHNYIIMCYQIFKKLLGIKFWYVIRKSEYTLL